MVSHPATPAVEALSRAAASRALVEAVGAQHATSLQTRALETLQALEHCDFEDGQIAALHALYTLALQCISLTSLVSSDFDDGAADNSLLDLDWDGYFGIAVAEAVAIGMSAVAAGLDADTSERAVEMLECLSIDLDGFFVVRLYSELCRLQLQDVARSGNEQRERLKRALQAICAWTLASVGRAVGYHQFTGSFLREWASGDCLWVLILSKGVLSIPPVAASMRDYTGVESGVSIPEELTNLQFSVINAVFELASPAVLLSSEEGGDSVSITVWNSMLTLRRAELCESVASCKLASFLISAAASQGPALGQGLVGFLVALLQMDLGQLGSLGQQGVEENVFQMAQKSSLRLRDELNSCKAELWEYLSGVPTSFGEFLPSQFIRDCADLAYAAPPCDSGACFINNCSDTVNELSSLLALCFFAANSGNVPGMGLLENSILNLPREHRDVVLERVGNWRGPVRLQTWQNWVSLFDESSTVQPPAPTLSQVTSLQPQAQAYIPGRPTRAGILQDLVYNAPAQYLCALDGQLMLDPVRSPRGYTFERSALAAALCTSGRCPVSGQPLTLVECVRDGELRKQVGAWVRQCHQMKSGKT